MVARIVLAAGVLLLSACERAPVTRAPLVSTTLTPNACTLLAAVGPCVKQVVASCGEVAPFLVASFVDEAGKGLVADSTPCDGGVVLSARGDVNAPRHVFYVGLKRQDGGVVSYTLSVIGNPAHFPPNAAVTVPCGLCSGSLVDEAGGWKRVDR